jgi:hypothetical protein
MQETLKELMQLLITIGQIALAYILIFKKAITDSINRKFDEIWRF